MSIPDIPGFAEATTIMDAREKLVAAGYRVFGYVNAQDGKFVASPFLKSELQKVNRKGRNRTAKRILHICKSFAALAFIHEFFYYTDPTPAFSLEKDPNQVPLYTGYYVQATEWEGHFSALLTGLQTLEKSER